MWYIYVGLGMNGCETLTNDGGTYAFLNTSRNIWCKGCDWAPSRTFCGEGSHRYAASDALPDTVPSLTVATTNVGEPGVIQEKSTMQVNGKGKNQLLSTPYTATCIPTLIALTELRFPTKTPANHSTPTPACKTPGQLMWYGVIAQLQDLEQLDKEKHGGWHLACVHTPTHKMKETFEQIGMPQHTWGKEFATTCFVRLSTGIETPRSSHRHTTVALGEVLPTR